MLGSLLRRFLLPGRAATPSPVTACAVGLDEFAEFGGRVQVDGLAWALAACHVGDYDAAAGRLRTATKQHPDDALAWALLGRSLRGCGEDADADRCFDSARSLDAALAGRCGAVGSRLYDRRAYAWALVWLQVAADLEPTDADLLNRVALASVRLGRVEDADRWFDRLADVSSADGVRLRRMLASIPQIYRSKAHLTRARARYAAELDALLSRRFVLPDPLAEIPLTNFFLCYQGGNDVDLQRKLAQLFLRACPALGYIADHCREPTRTGARVRVGVVSAFLRSHSVGAWYNRLFQHLCADERLELLLFTTSEDVDGDLRAAVTVRGRHVRLAPTLQVARQQIAAERLDVLVYTDVAQLAFTYFLAFGRLAPRQCLLAGHPATSGVPGLDEFVSSGLQEAPDADAHYSERLVRMKTIPVLVERPVPPERVLTRADLALPEDRTLYVCPMRLQKLHPDFDDMLGGILRRDPKGELILFDDLIARDWSGILGDRFLESIPDVAHRVRFRAWTTKRDEFHSILARADVLLDTPWFNGGVTSHLALGIGTPFVTWPTELFRGRMTYGMYRQMGVLDCVADTPEGYVQLAVELGRDPVRCAAIRSRVRERNAILYENLDAMAEFADFLVAPCTPALPPVADARR